MSKAVVVDKNFLDEPAFEDFLRTDPNNRAVLTDFLAIESFAGTSFRNISQAMAIVGKYPSQVFVLKSSLELIQLGPIFPHLRFEMIDWRLTKTFAKFSEQVRTVDNAAAGTRRRLLEQVHAARRRLDSIKAITGNLARFFEVLRDDTGDDLLRARRKGTAMPASDRARLLATIEHMARRFFQGVEGVPPMPNNVVIASFCYPFRIAIGIRLLALWWADNGGNVAQAKPETLRNDFVDMTYGVAATYWDGLFTLDGKAAQIHTEIDYLANDFFPTRALLPASRSLD
jgi:hypothetical protein